MKPERYFDGNWISIADGERTECNMNLLTTSASNLVISWQFSKWKRMKDSGKGV